MINTNENNVLRETTTMLDIIDSLYIDKSATLLTESSKLIQESLDIIRRSKSLN